MPDFQFKYGPSHRYWELALAQRADLWDGPDPLMHPNPQEGYWKARLSGGSWEPVAIHPELGTTGGHLVAQRGKNRVLVPAEDAWTYCGANPISYEAYTFWWREGKFPGEIEAPGIGHNSGETGKLTEEALHAKGLALFALDDKPVNQAKADELANYDTALLKYIQALDKARQTEKRAVIEQGQAVDKRYLPTIAELRDVREMIKKKLTSFLLMNPKAKVGGQLSKRASLRQTKVAVIDDYVALATYLSEIEAEPLLICLQNIANSMARAKNPEPLPGVRYEVEATVQ